MTRRGHLPQQAAPGGARVLKPAAESADIRGNMRNRDREPQTKIRATCPACGEVELTPPDVELHVCTAAERSYYAFVCPDCFELVTKPADQRVIRLLVSGGVPTRFWDPPAELLESHAGPTLTYDDLLDLHLLLEGPDWWSRLVAACR
jgi:predicted RNA-binding Zn-ribbon protein involved in translation (DUF1610 family)